MHIALIAADLARNPGFMPYDSLVAALRLDVGSAISSPQRPFSS
jgi:hypothetical protein